MIQYEMTVIVRDLGELQGVYKVSMGYEDKEICVPQKCLRGMGADRAMVLPLESFFRQE